MLRLRFGDLSMLPFCMDAFPWCRSVLTLSIVFCTEGGDNMGHVLQVGVKVRGAEESPSAALSSSVVQGTCASSCFVKFRLQFVVTAAERLRGDDECPRVGLPIPPSGRDKLHYSTSPRSSARFKSTWHKS